MNNEEEIQRIKNNIFDLGTICKDTITHKKECVKNEKSLKKEIRGLFLKLPEEIRKEKLRNEVVEISAKFPNSFDVEAFKEANPELFKRYFKSEMQTITTTIESFNKKQLEKDYPDVYNRFLKLLTPSITIK